MDEDTVTLWRPTGPRELALVEASGWRSWPPRLPDQPIFYPVLNEDYATRIARDWNVKASGAGFVTRFQVRKSFLDRYEVQQVGGCTILEYWIPAEDLHELNANIVGTIEVVSEYRADGVGAAVGDPRGYRPAVNQSPCSSRARAEYPRALQFLGAYLHQDFDVEYGSEAAAVAAAIADHDHSGGLAGAKEALRT